MREAVKFAVLFELLLPLRETIVPMRWWTMAILPRKQGRMEAGMRGQVSVGGIRPLTLTLSRKGRGDFKKRVIRGVMVLLLLLDMTPPKKVFAAAPPASQVSAPSAFSQQAIVESLTFFRSVWDLPSKLRAFSRPLKWVNALREKERRRESISATEMDTLHALWTSGRFPTSEVSYYFGFLFRQSLLHPTLRDKAADYWAQLHQKMGPIMASAEDLSSEGVTSVRITLDGTPHEVLGIGHSKRSLDDFIALLKRAGIETLVDVRTKPMSQWSPQFNRKKLGAALAEHGISYLWEGENLGGKLPEYDGDFQKYMQLDPEGRFTEGIQRLLSIVRLKKNPVGLLCSEKKVQDCHRRFVLAYLERHYGEERPTPGPSKGSTTIFDLSTALPIFLFLELFFPALITPAAVALTVAVGRMLLQATQHPPRVSRRKMTESA